MGKINCPRERQVYFPLTFNDIFSIICSSNWESAISSSVAANNQYVYLSPEITNVPVLITWIAIGN